MNVKKLLLVVGVLISVVSIGQTEPSIDSNNVVITVDMNNVGSEIESTREILDIHKNENYYSEELAKYDSLVSTSEERIHNSYSKFQEQEISALNSSSLNGLISSWNMNEVRVKANASKIRAMFKKTTASIEILKVEKRKWEATLVVFDNTEVPVSLKANVKKVLNDIGVVIIRLNENVYKLITLESATSEVSGIISMVKKQLLVANEKRSKVLFVQDKPAIWNVFFKRNKHDSLASQPESIVLPLRTVIPYSTEQANREKIEVSLDFINSNQESVFFFFVLWMFTVFLSVKYGSTYVLPDTIDQSVFAKRAMVYVHNNLIASASYLSILYSVFLFDYIPLLITEILVLTLIALNVVILYKARGKKIIKVAILLAVTYVIGQTNAFSMLGDVNFRIYLFVKIAITYWVLNLFVNYFREYKDSSNLKVLDKLDQLMYANNLLIIVATLANILGFVKLADITSLLIIQVIVVSFILYGILITSNGLVSIIFQSVWKPKNKTSIEFRESIQKRVLSLMNFMAAWFWVMAILRTVGIYELIKSAIIGLITSNLEIGSVSISLQGIFVAIAVVILTFVLTRFIGIIISDGILDSFKFKRGIPGAISLVVRYSLTAFGIMLSLSIAGINLSSFSLMAGALGIGIGFGLQNIISNFVSGLILVFERPLQEGDVVEVNNLLGVVKSIGIRSSNIRTYTGAEVVVPNESLISKELINWTLSDSNKRMEIAVGVDYGSDPRVVIKLLKEAAEGIEDVQKDPAPNVYFDKFGDSSIDFRLLFWVDHSIALAVKSDVMLRVTDILSENSINIPFPIRTLKMKTEVSELESNLLKNEDVDAGV